MRRSVVFFVFLAASVLANESNNGNLKNETASGRYHEQHDNYRPKHRGYEHHYRPPPLVDQFVCDLDATILVVASSPVKKEEISPYGDQNSYGNKNNAYGGQSAAYGAPPSGGGNAYGGQQNYGAQSGGYGQPSGGYGSSSGAYGAPPSGGYNGDASSNGYGESKPSYGSGHKEGSYSQKSVPNAVRLKCSHIATRSEHDCNSCCELAARRDHSVSKKDIFGFIIDADELINSEYGVARHKRNSGYPAPTAPPTPGYNAAASPPAPGYNNQPPASGYQSSPPPNYQPSSGYQQSPGSTYDTSSPTYPAPPAAGGYPAPTSGYNAATPASEYAQQGNEYSVPATQDYTNGGGSSSGSGGYSSDVGYPSYLQHPYPPKNGRCVCCAPKGYEHHYKSSHRPHRPERRRYEDSDEY